MPEDPADDTFPKLVLQHATLRGDRPAIREKALGIWQTWNWAEAAANMRAIACGLAALGLERGDKVAIIGDNRPQFYWSMLAAQCLGAVPVPVYQDAVAEEMVFVLDHAETRFAVVENQEQVDKLIGIKQRLPLLQRSSTRIRAVFGIICKTIWYRSIPCSSRAARSTQRIPAFFRPRLPREAAMICR